jgi:hypothetical protein
LLPISAPRSNSAASPTRPLSSSSKASRTTLATLLHPDPTCSGLFRLNSSPHRRQNPTRSDLFLLDPSRSDSPRTPETRVRFPAPPPNYSTISTSYKYA